MPQNCLHCGPKVERKLTKKSDQDRPFSGCPHPRPAGTGCDDKRFHVEGSNGALERSLSALDFPRVSPLRARWGVQLCAVVRDSGCFSKLMRGQLWWRDSRRFIPLTKESDRIVTSADEMSSNIGERDGTGFAEKRSRCWERGPNGPVRSPLSCSRRRSSRARRRVRLCAIRADGPWHKTVCCV